MDPLRADLLLPDPADTPPQELAYARQHFFLPHRYRDPFHTNAVSTESFVTYDAYDLLVQETRDALGNRVTVGERDVDPTQPPVRLRAGLPRPAAALVMDPNRNRSAVAFDALGMVVGTAVMGKPAPAPVEGDSLNGIPRRPDPGRDRPVPRESQGADGGHAARRRHHPRRLRPDGLLARARSDEEATRRRRHARPRDTRERTRTRGRPADPGQLLLLRRLRPRDPEEDPGRARTGAPARRRRQDHRGRGRPAA